MSKLKVEAPELQGYEYVRHLGTGGYSEVFLYLDQRLRRQVAIKVLTQGGSEDEARAMAAVSSHTHIVDIYRTDVTEEGLPYLVMQYYPRQTFAQRVQRGPLPVGEVLKLGVELSGALEHAHQAGVLHRDIKPANILTSSSDRPGLADFGIASHASSPRDQVSVSLPWVPPEVLEGRTADERGDVYSLAATLFTLLEGRAPFVLRNGDDGDDAVIRRTLGQDPPRVTATSVPESLNALLRSAMAKRPQERPARAETFGRALQAIEAELKLTRTPLEIPSLDEDLAQVVDDDADATRSRAQVPRVVTPDVDDSTRTPSGLAGGLIERVPARPAPRVWKPGSPQVGARLPEAPPLEETRGRTPGPSDATDGAEASRPRTAVLVGGAATVAALVIALFIISTGASSGSDRTPAAIDQSTTSPTIVAAVPRVQDLRIERTSADGVRVTWAYPDFAEGDVYLWQRCDPGAEVEVRRSTAPRVDLNDAPAGTYPCVAVAVQRSDGSESDPEEVTLR